MKKLFAITAALLLTLNVLAQNCTFTYQTNPNASVSFTSTSTYTSPQYYGRWLFGNFSTYLSATNATVAHTYNFSGAYLVVFQVIDSLTGNTVCSFSDSVLVPVTNCQFTVTPDSTASGSFIFNGLPINQGQNIYWDFGDSTGIVYGTVVGHQYSAPGTYTVCATVFDPVTQAVTCTGCSTVVVTNSSNCYAAMSLQVSNGAVYAQSQVIGGPVTSYLWTFGDGGISTTPNAVHTYAAPGTYLVCLTITTAGGCVDTTCQAILVTSPGACNANFIAVPDSLPGAYYFLNTSTGNYTSVLWDFGDGTFSPSLGNNWHMYNSAGIYYVCLTISDSATGCSDTYCDSLYIQQPSTCSFTWQPDSGNSQLILFQGLPQLPGNNLEWDYGDGLGFTGGGTNVAYLYNTPGTYTVCMNEYLPGSVLFCSSCQTITVATPPLCNFTVTQTPNTPGTFNFLSTMLQGASYNWDFGDSTAGNGFNVNHTYTTPGNYLVTLTIGLNGAIFCTTSQWVYVAPNSWCQASFSQVSLGLNAYFINQSTILPVNQPPVAPPVNYFWTFGDGTTSTLQYPNHQYAAPGSYLVCLTGSTTGCTATYCDSIVIDTVIPNPTTCNAYFVFTQTNPFNVVGVNLSSGINLSFSWSFGDGGTSSVPYPTHAYNGTGSYLVCLTVTDANGCSSTHCDTLTVDSLGNVVYRGVSSSGFTLNIVAPNLLGTAENLPAIGALYPVPASDLLFIRFSEQVKEEVMYTVMSLEGRRILSGTLNGAVATLDIAALQQGMYLLEILTADGRRDNRTFVKQ